MIAKSLFNIPRDILNEAVKASGAKTRTDAVILGLKELIHKKRTREFMALGGSGALGLNIRDLKRMRRR